MVCHVQLLRNVVTARCYVMFPLSVTLVYLQFEIKIGLYTVLWGYAVAQLVEALRYKSEGRGFDSRWCHWNFSLT